MTTQALTINTFKSDLANMYMQSIKNYLWDDKKALSFLSWASFLVQKTPKLLECDKESLFNSIIQVAELKLTLGPSWEAYILPYEKKKNVNWKWIVERVEAQMQLWYKWIVTLLYRAWIQSIRSEIIYEKDEFEYVNWKIHHKIDIFKSTAQRWEPIWAYVIAKVNWDEISKAMNKDDIFKFKTFSQSAKSSFSPWNSEKDPELNMWKKTVLKQLSKMLPQNETLAKAIEIDNKDSIIWDDEVNLLDNKDVLDKALEWFWEWSEWDKKNIS